jgi:desulfoferrodoxin (superoxide reductase-like protein)
MKYIKSMSILLMLVSTVAFSSIAIAHPPLDMELSYDLELSMLSVTIIHETPAPTVHYVNRVTIELNEEIIISEEYDSQPTTSEFTYDYTVEANSGDIITVIAYCNIQGSITRSLTVRDPTQDEPPTVEIKNPTKGYFHFSGIRLFATYFDIIYDTMGFGGFRVKPVQVYTEDDVDANEDIVVKIYIDDELRNIATYNPRSGFHELKWTGPRLGVFTLKATAEDTYGNIAVTEMDVWYFCFIPE